MMAKHVDNLSEEVKKGLREKATQGSLRGHLHPTGTALGSAGGYRQPIQITADVAEGLAAALRTSDEAAEQRRREAP